MWIKPGFGKVKWALAIKSRQAKRQEPLSLELKAKAGGSEGWGWGGGVYKILVCVCRSLRSSCTCIIQQAVLESSGRHHTKPGVGVGG